MPSINNCTLIAITILYIFVFIWLSKNNIINYFTSMQVKGTDNIWYKIQNNLKKQDKAVEYLEEINKRIVVLGRHLQKKYANESACPDKVKQVKNLLVRYNPDNIIENSPKIKGESSYTINKGNLIAMCLRNKDDPEYDVHDFESVMFAYLHEIAHVTTDVKQHEPGFWETFKWLLGEAEEAGVYKNIDFAKTPINYCGHYVNYSPYFDTSIKKLC
jgi:predicted DNA-binding protein (MmcQ/YjbR family)